MNTITKEETKQQLISFLKEHKDDRFGDVDYHNFSIGDLKWSLQNLLMAKLIRNAQNMWWIAPHKKKPFIISSTLDNYEFINGKLHGKIVIHILPQYGTLIPDISDLVDKCHICQQDISTSNLDAKDWDGKVYYSCPKCHFILYADGAVELPKKPEPPKKPEIHTELDDILDELERNGCQRGILLKV